MPWFPDPVLRSASTHSLLGLLIRYSWRGGGVRPLPLVALLIHYSCRGTLDLTTTLGCVNPSSVLPPPKGGGAGLLKGRSVVVMMPWFTDSVLLLRTADFPCFSSAGLRTSLFYLNTHILRLCKKAKRLQPALAPEAGVLHPAERSPQVTQQPAIHPNDSSL